MHIHILGICGTFMGGLAVLGSALKDKITGSDENIYPPMSTQLDKLGIKIFQGYTDITQLTPKPDLVVVGNVMRRGMPVVEALLNQQLPMVSGPAWLASFVLQNKHVLAVSGTHGKTTTTSMLAWILEFAGLTPGFLIGGIPNDFGVSARVGQGPYFVIEADEYDSAFFDKRSKFMHYHPRTLIINNIEFDHADIFADLAAIQLQFHHLVRTVPEQGLIIHPASDQNVLEVFKKGCWTKRMSFSFEEDYQKGDWYAKNYHLSGKEFQVCFQKQNYGTIQWALLGRHNVHNALAAIAAAAHIGIDPKIAVEALTRFQGVKRRMEIKGIKNGITVYDDFAHHPTAIHTTLAGLRGKVGSNARIVAVLDIRSNTMKAGFHQKELGLAVKEADAVYFYHSPDIVWDVTAVWKSTEKPGGVHQDIAVLLKKLLDTIQMDDHVIFMSNGGFGGIHNALLEAIA